MSELHHPGPLGVQIEEIGTGAVVIHLVGRLDMAALLVVRRHLRRLAVGRRWIVLDVAGVPEFHPSTAAVLAQAQRGLRRQGARLVLWQLRAQPRRLVEDKRLAAIVDVIRGDLAGWLAERTSPDAPAARPEPRVKFPSLSRPMATP